MHQIFWFLQILKPSFITKLEIPGLCLIDTVLPHVLGTVKFFVLHVHKYAESRHVQGADEGTKVFNMVPWSSTSLPFLNS